MDDTKALLETKLKLLREKEELMKDLPHLYGRSWYPWAKKFFDSRNRLNLLCAANQISKSSTQIRKCIHWATAQEIWSELFPYGQPNQFWYLYPSKEVATVEFEKKWLPEFMPRGNQKESEYYGWEAEYDHKFIKAIHFNSGVSIYFKTYAQDPKTLQSGSVYAIFCDEELPEHLYDELKLRLAGTRGYFHMVFTATLGQEMWWRAVEAIGTSQELFPGAFKLQVSMYDCLEYEDGSKTPWTRERIQEVIDDCKSRAEVLRRVYGRFVKEEGRTYHAFDPTKHYVQPFAIPDNYQRYCAADIGSGGENGHPSALVYVAVRPDHKMGYIYKGWRGDGVQTTAGDVLQKHSEMTYPREHFVLKKYDFAAKDFGTLSDRKGVGFTKAEKSHEIGESLVNDLYKHGMLYIFDTDELRKLGTEMLNLQKSTPKTKAKDDFCDAQRYAVVDIPWDLSAIAEKNASDEPEKQADTGSGVPKTQEEWDEYHLQQRRERFYDPTRQREVTWDDEISAEIEAFNELAGS